MLTASAAPRGLNGEPNLVARGEAINPLQDQIKRKGEFQLAHNNGGWLFAVECHQVATAYLTLRLETEFFEEALDGEIKARLQSGSWWCRDRTNWT